MRKDLELAEYARDLGLHVVLSTNGTLIDRNTARKFVELKFAYIGISLDSPTASTHDWFRGQDGAYARTMEGFRCCAGCRFREVCGGSLRARAEISTGDPWASDPGCYLTDEEIAGELIEPLEVHALQL